MGYLLRIEPQLGDNSKGDLPHPTLWMRRNWTVGPNTTNRAQAGKQR